MKDELQALADEHDSPVESRIAELYSAAYLQTSPVIDQYSNWLLGAAGATAAIVIANLTSFVNLLGASAVRWGGLMLTLSALCGFLAKSRARKVEMYMMGAKLSGVAMPLVERHRDFSEKSTSWRAKQTAKFVLVSKLKMFLPK